MVDSRSKAWNTLRDNVYNPGGAENIKEVMNSIELFEKVALPAVLQFEGGYVDHPADKGGATNNGITQATFDHFNDARSRKIRPVSEIMEIEVKEIYYFYYWIAGRCDEIKHPKAAVLYFDSCVNHGISRASKFLQEAVDVKVDGIIGKVTLEAVNKYKEKGLIYRYFEIREEFYHRLVDRKPSQKVFLKGWLNRLEKLKVILDKMEAA